MEPGYWYSFIILAVLLLAADSTHYRGCTMSWKYTNEGKLIVDYELVWNRESADGKTTTGKRCDETTISSKELSGQAIRWACLSKNCGIKDNLLPTMQYECTAFSEEEKYSLGGRSVELDLALNSVYHFGNNPTGAHKGYWITPLQNGNSAAVIRFYTEINLNPRSDNSQINNSPKTKAIPNIIAHVGCPVHFIIPYADPDKDRVRCRFALDKTADDDKLDECGGLCLDRELLNASLNENSCEIDWTPPDGGAGNYGATFVLEDYLSTSSSEAMSEVPLQFVFKVIDNKLKCDEMPEFCCGTPQDSLCLAIPTGDSLTFTVAARPRNDLAIISRIELSQQPEGMVIGPLNNIVGTDIQEIIVSWTPSASQNGDTFFLCFGAFDDLGGSTEKRCLTFITGSESPEVDTLIPTSGDDFTPNKRDAEIVFTKKVSRPTAPRYIWVFESATNNEIEQIDTSSSPHIIISSDSLTVSFRLQGIYLVGAQYYILVDPGAFVGESGCSGGGIAAEGVIEKDEWSFTVVFQCDSNDECHSQASCISSTCQCDMGFSGDGIAECNDIKECEKELDDCHPDAVCTNTVGSFECSCPTGFRGDGTNCIDINECVEETDNCHQFADCMNTKGLFDCSCLTGFEGNGVNCVDINECEREMDDCVGIDHEECENTVGSFKCVCVTGFEKIGDKCEDIDECAIGTPCGSNGDCKNTDGSFTCTCNSGYEKEKDGMKCVDIDECEKGADTCLAIATCINEPGSFTCQCPPPLTGDGVTSCTGCVDDSDCHEFAKCTAVSDSTRICICDSGFTGNGDSCIDIDECIDRSHNCANNAICDNTPGSFVCKCKPGFTGDGVSSCTDITNCTRDWPTQRDHWLVADNEWKHVTRNCSLLGDRLPDVTFNMGDPPIQQWRDISSDYLNELNKWLESAASLHIPGIPSSVSFHETDPEDLWGKVKEFVDDVMDKWYEHVGKPNKLERSAPSGQCANKQVEEWVHSRDDGEELQEEYEEEFNGRCDAR